MSYFHGVLGIACAARIFTNNQPLWKLDVHKGMTIEMTTGNDNWKLVIIINDNAHSIVVTGVATNNSETSLEKNCLIVLCSRDCHTGVVMRTLSLDETHSIIWSKVHYALIRNLARAQQCLCMMQNRSALQSYKFRLWISLLYSGRH